MGILDLECDREHFSYIRRRLRSRGLKPDLDEVWEIHGPHPGMNYYVYVGFAIPKDEKCNTCGSPYLECQHVNCFYVAIFPGAIYEIESPEKWGRDPEMAIPMKEKS